jgi:hypothetical protein
MLLNLCAFYTALSTARSSLQRASEPEGFANFSR